MRERKGRKNREAGFSLIELMISIVILMVGVIAVAQLVPASMQSNYRSRNDSTALITAQRLLEQIAQQRLNTQAAFCPGGTNAPGGHYMFCDQDGDGIALGSVTGVVAGLAVTNDGCPLAADGGLDWSAANGACGGYWISKVIEWNPNATINTLVEVRWHVTTLSNNGRPIRKVFVAGARSGVTGGSTTGYQTTVSVRNLRTMVTR